MSVSDDNSALPFVFVDYATNPLDALARDLITLEKPNPSDLSQYTIWCDSRSVIHTMRLKLLAAAKAANINSLLLPTIITLQDWATQQNPPDKPLISETNKELLLVEAIRHSPGLFQTNNAWPLAKELVSLFNECTLAQIPLSDGETSLREALLKSYQFPVANIENISRESEIVYRLWQAYQEQIQARQWTDPVTHYCETLINYASANNNEYFYMVGKHRFAAAEVLFFHHINKQHRLALYSAKVSANQFGTHHHPHLHLISETSNNANASDQREQALDIVYNKNSHTYKRIQNFKHIYHENIFKNWLSVYSCNSIERHVNAVCLQVKMWLLEDIRPIGIIAGDRLLARRIRAVLEEEGIKPTDLGGWTLSTTSAATSIEIFLDAVEHNFKKDSLLDLLSSPFLPFNYNENEHYQHQVFQTRKLLRKHRNTPKDNIDTFISLITIHSESTQDDSTDITKICELAKQASDELFGYKNLGEYELYNLSISLLTALDVMGIKDCLHNDAAGLQLLDTLETNINSARNNSIKINWKEWRQWLRDLFEHNYFIPEDTDSRITLCGFEHIDDFNFKAAVIAGVEETRLISANTKRTFFNEKVRHELHLPTTHETTSINFVRFRQLLQQCEHLLLSAETENHGEPQEICSWVKLIELFSKQAYSSSLRNTQLDQLLQLRQKSKRDTNQFTNLGALVPAPFATSPLVPSKISATQYQSLIDCPYQYFAKYVLALSKQESTDEFEASNFGQLVHQSLHEFHFGEKHKTGITFNNDNRSNLITQLSSISSELFMRAPFPTTVKEGWLQRWLSNVPFYIDWAIERGQQWKTLRGEASLEVKLDNDVILHGHVDRIDSDTNNYAVIDYKTGSSKPSKKNVLNGETVQLPFYALLDKKITQAEYITLGTQGEVKPSALVSDDELEELKSEHLPRIESLIKRLRNQAPLPANGDNKVCRVCDYQGLCRKSHWAN
ncbi:MAG: PD-(D/E)XK nuclease family protein [Gammaproteobacteria bacterium]|nr:PD-(D/E)XK nuclease family protein [Gammaproteobacteria bacterium]